ncbi:MAG: site-specific DNA-methyltransferase, partial [Acidobacteriota bacterium]
MKELLAEMFQFDRADLDFGIYRIMNARRDEINGFLENDLLPQVREVLSDYESESRSGLLAELEKAKEQAKALGFEDPAQAPRVKELQARYNAEFDRETVENDVFSHLYNFFRRYYNEGDFISLRRYKEGVYAIPYEGEEVKLYWANHDQYYVKTSEAFRNYVFRLDDGKPVHFKLVEADTVKDNNRPQSGKERRFILGRGENRTAGQGEKETWGRGEIWDEVDGALVFYFRYCSDPENRKQAELNAEAVERIVSLITSSPGLRAAWSPLLDKRPTEKNPNRTLLEKHLTDYTARNTFDYFIHKDLGGFLRRELDFYIKNEVMHLDDIESESAPRVEQYLAKIRAIRRIAHKIIDFLVQLENFQKKLWLKKKFVVETQYCVTLDRVPEALYPEIAANDAQREEWVRLFAIDDIKGDLTTPGYSNPLTVDFLKANPYLVLDTRHFGEDFKRRLLASFDDLDEQCDGLLLHSENFQALNLLMDRYRGKVECVHIDPPYNTQTSGFVYKNDYQHSSWLAMMAERLLLAWETLTSDGHLLIHIDENEQERLHLLCNDLQFPSAGTIIWDKKNPMLGRKGIATQHEYILWRTRADGSVYLRNVNQRMILEKAREIVARHGCVTEQARQEFASWIATCPGLSGGERAYRFLDDDGRVFRPVSLSAGTPSTDARYFQPLIHPITKQPCPVPPTGWSRPPETFENLIKEGLIVFGRDHSTLPQLKLFLTEESRRQVPSVIADTGRGKKDMIDLGLVFPYSHPVSLYVGLLGAAISQRESIVLDFFAGSGTTAHAVINLNREDGGRRKYILVEMGEYFDTVLVPRIKKVVYSKDWKDGKPVSREGISHMFKYIRLESYEDTLNNLELKQTEVRQSLLEQHRDFREDYMLRYMLELESRGSASLLNLDRVEDPFSYTLDIATGTAGETKPTVVDLVETFNYLIGLHVKTTDQIGGVRVVTGFLGQGDGETRGQGERVLILWRNTRELDNDML